VRRPKVRLDANGDETEIRSSLRVDGDGWSSHLVGLADWVGIASRTEPFFELRLPNGRSGAMSAASFPSCALTGQRNGPIQSVMGERRVRDPGSSPRQTARTRLHAQCHRCGVQQRQTFRERPLHRGLPQTPEPRPCEHKTRRARGKQSCSRGPQRGARAQEAGAVDEYFRGVGSRPFLSPLDYTGRLAVID
jgi:hypothetical protein